MPALPFFTFLAPTNTSTNANTGAPLAMGDLYGSHKDIDAKSLDSSFDLSQDTLAFWQQLQTANDSYALPEGQGLAAFVGPLMPSQPLTETGIETEVNTAEFAQLNGLYVYSEQVDLESTDVSIPAFQHIENLRNAQPQLNQGQASQPHLSQAQLQANPLDSKPTITAQTGLVQDESKLAAMVMTAESTKAAQQTSAQQTPPLIPTTDQPASAAQATMTATQSGIKFTEAELAKLNEGELPDDLNLDTLNHSETKSLHEKPLTLQSAKEVINTSQVSPANVETFAQTDGKLLSGEALQTVMRDGQPTNRSMALDGSVQSQVQNTEKSPASMQKLDVPPNHPQWNEQVAKRVMIMANESMQTARIQLDPPELGALEVKIKVQHDQVSVSFGSNHQVVRDALEGQSPRLRELLEQQGINLTDVDVSEHSNQQSDQQNQGEFAQEGPFDDTGNLITDDVTPTVTLESDSLVDYFA